MSEFPYTPLNAAEKSIRILRIQMGYWRDDIVCFLVESYASQEEGFGYNALSYTWGGLEHTLDGVEHPPHIFLDWHKFEVGENLYWAIQYIRRADKDVYLWVDAICINQEDEQEKGHQVKQMGEIYSAAEEVFIWLGPSNDDIGVLMEWITSIDVQATEAQAIGNNEDWISLCSRFMDVRPDKPSQISRSRQIGALTELLGRPWFNRVWILQEVAKARTAKILCGIFSCPARTFAQMPSLMGLKITEHTQAVLDIMSRTRKNSWWSRKRYLHFLLIKFEKSHASVVRDKVYASLGMSEDVGNPERFYPCYQKTDNQVFRDTVCFLLFKEILDSSHSFPVFKLPELYLPLIQLAEKTLSWTLGQGEELRDSSRRTAALLVDQINEGQLKTADLLLRLAEVHGHVDELHLLLSQGNVNFSLRFESERNILQITSEADNVAPVSLTFTPGQSRETKDERPIFPFKEDENMAETINRLLVSSSSKEEVLRAYVWAGDGDFVQKQLAAGADVNGADVDGYTALHLAVWRNHFEIAKLLLEKGADVEAADVNGNRPLHFAAMSRASN